MIVVGNINSRYFLWLTVAILYSLISLTKCSISVIKVTTRTPREKDIGIIFDIEIINTENQGKELLEFRIRSKTECCVNLTQNTIASDVGKIVGGSFGEIGPGEIKLVSLIWPTTEVFNRVGHCEVIITSTNTVKNEEKHLTQQIPFDTRFQQIDPTGKNFRSSVRYHECENWDMNFLANCTPVDCEAKYFGKRNYYNRTSKMCEPVVCCDGEFHIYDIYSNECINTKELMTDEEIEKVKHGHFKDFSMTFEEVQKNSNCKPSKRERFDPPTDLYCQIKAPSLWSQIVNGIFLIAATIIIYSFGCFLILVVVNWLSRSSPDLRREKHGSLAYKSS